MRRTARAYLDGVKFPTFDMERMQATWEHRIKYDLSEPGAEAMTLEEAARDPREPTRRPIGYARGVGRDGAGRQRGGPDGCGCV